MASASTLMLFANACSPEKDSVDASNAATGDAEASVYSFRRGVNISHWLAQNSDQSPYGSPWFAEDDVVWIAGHGFDHLRIPVDGRVWQLDDGSLDLARIEPFDRAASWARNEGLGVVLDMHFLPGADFNADRPDNTLFTDPAKMRRVADFWRKVAARYADAGPWLRFELLNEPVAEKNEQVNTFNRVMIAAVRESNPTRPIYITCNRWSNYQNIPDVDMTDDPNVFLTFHFYEPFIFTHQRASWNSMPPDMAAVPFPGTVPDLRGNFGPGDWQAGWSGRELTREEHVDQPFDQVFDWVTKHAADREVYVGEFGVYRPADEASQAAYVAAVRSACELRGWSWAIWDYRGGFAVRGRDGNPTAIWRGLFPQ